MKYSTTTILALSSASATTASFVTQPQPAAHSSGTRSAHYDRTFALSAKNDKKDDNKDHEGLPIDLEQAKKQMMGMTDGWKKMVSNNPFGIKMEEEEQEPEEVHNSMLDNIKKSVMGPVMNRMEEIKKEGTNQQKNKEAPKDIDVPPAASNPFVDGFKNSLMASSSKPKPATEEVKAAKQVKHFSSVDNWDSSSATEEEVKEVKQANENTVVDHFKKSLTDMIMDPVVNNTVEQEATEEEEASPKDADQPAMEVKEKVVASKSVVIAKDPVVQKAIKEENIVPATSKADDAKQSTNFKLDIDMEKQADEAKEAIAKQLNNFKFDIDMEKQADEAKDIITKQFKNFKLDMDMEKQADEAKDIIAKQLKNFKLDTNMEKQADEAKRAITAQLKNFKLDIDMEKQQQQAGEMGGQLVKLAKQNPLMAGIQTELVEPIMSREIEKDVPYEIIAGATIGFAGVSLLAGFTLVESLAVGVAGAYLSITPGKVGEGMRKVGRITWAAGGKSWDATRMIGGATRDIIEANAEGGVDAMVQTFLESVEQQRGMAIEPDDPGGLRRARRQYEAAQRRAEQARGKLVAQVQQGVERKAMEVRAATMMMRRNSQRARLLQVEDAIARKAEEVRTATRDVRRMSLQTDAIAVGQEKLRLAEEEQALLLQEARAADEARRVREVEAAHLEEERVQAEQQEQAERDALLVRIAEEARLAEEEERLAAEATRRRLAAEAQLARQELQAREALATKAAEIIEWKAKDVRIATQMMRAEAAQKELELQMALEEAQRALEQAQMEEAQRRAEEQEKARLAEEMRLADEQRTAFEAEMDQIRLQARAAEEHRAAQEAASRQQDEEHQVRDRLRAKAQAIIEWKAEDVRIATDMMRAEAAQREEEAQRERCADAAEAIERGAIEVRIATRAMREGQAMLEKERLFVAAEREKAAIAEAQEAFERKELVGDWIEEAPSVMKNDDGDGGKGFGKDASGEVEWW